MLIEVIAQSVGDAVAAEAGGADRLELVRDLDQDGLTPPPAFVRAVRAAVRIPVYVMVRPWDRFTLAPGEREVVVAEARAAVGAGAHGLVFGYLDADGGLDVAALAAVRAAVGPGIGLTFHRAFDRLAEPEAALPLLAAHGVERILTSGGASTALEGQDRLRRLVPLAAAHGLIVMAGGGLTPENVAALVRTTGVTEVHLGSGVHDPPSPSAPVSRERVAAARQVLAALTATSGALLTAGPSIGQEAPGYPTFGRIIREGARLDSLIAPDTRIEVLASGFEWTEGPLWMKEGGYLLFSDIPRNSIMKWQEGAGVSLFMKPSGYTGVTDYGREPGSNGLLWDPEGRLVCCEHGDRRLSRLERDGGKRTLVDHYMGKRLNSPNDAVFRSSGDLYFTDPPYGLPKQADDPRRELDFCGVYRLARDGKLTLLTKEMTRPNGIAFSPDEKTLYVAQSDPDRAIWMAFPVKEDGTLGKSRVFADVTPLVNKLPGLPDGMQVDRDGNLFATGPGGVQIFAPDGAHLGRIDTGQKTSNCAWGEDGTVLYMTADHYVCRIRTKTKGLGW